MIMLMIVEVLQAMPLVRFVMCVPMYPSRVVVIWLDSAMGRRMMVMMMRSRMMISHACY